MMNEPNAMQEIHAIREQIYEETKNMTSEEYSAYFSRKTDAALKQSGYKLMPIEGETGVRRLVRI
ncbi:MAG: hypothetical protein FWD58_09390 [Firmicutes bacterium]|nr:hypothetical protein [Bacillota bacterium]